MQNNLILVNMIGLLKYINVKTRQYMIKKQKLLTWNTYKKSWHTIAKNKNHIFNSYPNYPQLNYVDIQEIIDNFLKKSS